MTERLDLHDAEWRRISTKYAVVEAVGLLIMGVILSAATSIPTFVTGIQWLVAIPISLGIIFLINIALTPRRVRAIGYMLREDDLVFRRGLMFRRVVAVPYGRMQLVDINRGPLDRAVGLSELKFVTAAASTGVVIPGLPEQDAEELRDTLVALAESRRAGL
ncbi:hypothetical protein A20C1_07978 [marine actinobacterium PHSC20C1]|nr:hypothetical protein A20C1_07978 [marine actinobacterium PHSC20C1]